MRKRIALVGLLVLVGGYILCSSVCAVGLAQYALHPGRLPIAHGDQARKYARENHADLKDVSIQAEDSETLRGWYLAPQHDNGSAVLLLHGVSDNREGVAGYAVLFAKNGYRVLLVDSRAHGESGGEIATYGIRERDDVHRWVSWLYSQAGTECVYGFGESMGAAIALQSRAVEKHFCAVAVESPFATFREVSYERVGRFVGAGPWFGRTIGRLPIEMAFLYARLRYGVDLRQADPSAALAHSTTPVLLMHGTADVNILPLNSARLVAANSAHSTLWLVPGAVHCGAYSAAPAEFERRLLDWFAAFKSPSSLLRGSLVPSAELHLPQVTFVP